MENQTLPQWYISLVEIKALIDSGNWVAVHEASKRVTKLLHANAPTVKNSFDKVVILTMGGTVNEVQKRELLDDYAKSLEIAKKELETSDYNRIVKEEEIASQLSVIDSHINTSWRIIWNYWRGSKASDFVEWEKLGRELKDVPMTRMGRLRLMARHNNMSDRITPSFGKMIVQLWPLAAMWVIKKAGPLIVSVLFKKQLEKRKTKKQMAALQSKRGGGFSIGNIKKATSQSRRRKKRSRHKRA